MTRKLFSPGSLSIFGAVALYIFFSENPLSIVPQSLIVGILAWMAKVPLFCLWAYIFVRKCMPSISELESGR